MFDIFNAKGFAIIDFDGPVFDTYTVKNAPKYFDAGSTAPFDRTRDLVSAEAVRYINAAVRNGIYPIFNTSALGTTFRGNPLPFTKSWGDPNSDTYAQHLREFQKKGYDAKRRQFESLMSRLAPDVRGKLSAQNNLIVTQPSAGEDKIMTTQGFFNKHNMPMDDWVKSKTTVFDDEQGNLDKFAAAGFTDTRLTLPSGFAKMPFAKDRGQSWPTLNGGKAVIPHTGTYAPSMTSTRGPRILSTPHWGTYPSILLSPSSIQGLDYAKAQHNSAAVTDYTLRLLGQAGFGADESGNTATAFGIMAEDRLNAALTHTSNIDDFYKYIASEDFQVPDNGGTRTITPEWSKQQIADIIAPLSQAQQQRVLGTSIDVDGQSVWLSGKPDYYKVFPPSREFPKGHVVITDAKTSGIYGKAKTPERLRMAYHTQMAAYSYMASLENPGMPVYSGFLHMPVKGNKLSDIQWVPNRVDKNGAPLPENAAVNETFLKSKMSQYFRNLKAMGVLDKYAERNHSKHLTPGPIIKNNEIRALEELTGGTASVDASDLLPTESNPTPVLSTMTRDEAIANDKKIGLRDIPSPAVEALLSTQHALSENVATLIDIETNRSRSNVKISDTTIRKWMSEDPTGELAAQGIAKRFGMSKAYITGKGTPRKLEPIIAARLEQFKEDENARKEELQQKEAERLEQKEAKRLEQKADREYKYSARRQFTIASRIADLDMAPLFKFQREKLAEQYAAIDTTANVDDPTDAQRFTNALRDVNKALQAAERNTKAWTSALSTIAHTVNQPWYNGEQLVNTATSGLSQLNSSASGIIPKRLRGVTGHTTAIGQDALRLWWDKNYNLKYKAVETARPVYTSVIGGAATILGGIFGGPLGAIAAGSIGTGLAGIPSAISQVKGNVAERNLKVALGHADIALNLMSIFGELAKNMLAIPLKLFTNAIKITAGSLSASAILIDRYMKQGLESLQGLGNPIKGLSGVKGYRQYQGLGFADTFLGHQKGTTNAGIEAFGKAQARLYSMGELDDTRVISAAQLGVFNEVYGNHENPEQAYSAMVNKLIRNYNSADARGRKKILSLAGDIDSSLPQTLQVMSDMKITNYDSLKQPPGVYWRGIGDEERGAMRWTSAQWQATKEMLGITKSRIASRIWQRVGRGFYNGVSRTGDLISQGHWKDWETQDENGNIVKHKGAINTALGTFKELVENIKEWWNTSELSSAIVEFIKEAVDNVKEWLKGLDISGIAETLGGKISELFGNINWQSIMEGPLGGIIRVIESIGTYITNTFINVFNTLRGMRFDLVKFMMTKGKEGLSFGSGKLTNESLIDNLSYSWSPKVWIDDEGRTHHSLQGITDQTDLGTELSVAIEGKTSVLGLMRRFEDRATESVGIGTDGREMSLGEYVTFLFGKTKYGKDLFDPKEWTAHWQSTTGTQWGDTTWLGTTLGDYVGSTPGTAKVSEMARNGVGQVVDMLRGAPAKLGQGVLDMSHDSLLKIKMEIVDRNGKTQEVPIASDSLDPDKNREVVLRLFSEQLIKEK